MPSPKFHWLSRPIPEPGKYFKELRKHQRKYGPFKSYEELKSFTRNVSKEVKDRIGEGWEVMQFLLVERILVEEAVTGHFYFDEAHAYRQWAQARQKRRPALPVGTVAAQIERIKALETTSEDDSENVAAPTTGPAEVPKTIAAEVEEDSAPSEPVEIEHVMFLTPAEAEIQNVLEGSSGVRVDGEKTIFTLDPRDATYEIWSSEVKLSNLQGFASLLLKFFGALFTSILRGVTERTYEWKCAPEAIKVLPLSPVPFEVRNEAFWEFLEKLEDNVEKIVPYLRSDGFGALHNWLMVNGYRPLWTNLSLDDFARKLVWMEGDTESYGYFAMFDDKTVVSAVRGFTCIRPVFTDTPAFKFIPTKSVPPQTPPIVEPVKTESVPELVIAFEANFSKSFESMSEAELRTRINELGVTRAAIDEQIAGAEAALMKHTEKKSAARKALETELAAAEAEVASLQSQIDAEIVKRDRALARLAQLV